MPTTHIKGGGVDDGTRTRDNRNHNPGLYQLSYNHHIKVNHPELEIYPVGVGKIGDK